MSTSAAKVYVWILATAGRRGMIETEFAKIAKANGLSLKVLRAALRELEENLSIHVERATSRYGQTRINLNTALAGTLGRNPKPRKPSPQGTIETNGGNHADDFKPSLQVSIEAGAKPSPAGSIDSSNRQETKADRLATAIASSGNLAGELTDVQRKALEYLSFQPDHRFLSFGFVTIAGLLYEDNPLSPGKFAKRLTAECLDQQRIALAEGKSPARFYFPPAFERWRGILRDREWCAAKDREWCAEQATAAVA
jgi:hypothetical protein